MALGDYSNYRKWYTDKATDVQLAATDAGKTNVVPVKDANHQLYVQKIEVQVLTAAAQTVTFQDNAGTPVKIAVLPASQSTPVVFDFGPRGYALTAGKELDISNTAGPALAIHIEAYERIVSGAINVNSGAGAQ